MMTFSFLIAGFSLMSQPSSDGWDIFAKVRFTEKFFEASQASYLVPFLDSRIRFYEGKEITLEGYYLPFDLDNKHTVVISRNPYSMCFFCGAAGPESVAEIVFESKPPRFKADQIIKVTGTLKLNDRDINRVNFILEKARLETK